MTYISTIFIGCHIDIFLLIGSECLKVRKKSSKLVLSECDTKVKKSKSKLVIKNKPAGQLLQDIKVGNGITWISAGR